MQRTFNIISDPGHAWCKVPLRLLCKLRMLSDITVFSYIRKDMAYLEEDCDLSKFAAVYKNETGEAPKFNEQSSNKISRVRNYEGYSPTRAAEIVLKDLINHSTFHKVLPSHIQDFNYLSTLLPEEHISVRMFRVHLASQVLSKLST